MNNLQQAFLRGFVKAAQNMPAPNPIQPAQPTSALKAPVLASPKASQPKPSVPMPKLREWTTGTSLFPDKEVKTPQRPRPSYINNTINQFSKNINPSFQIDPAKVDYMPPQYQYGNSYYEPIDKYIELGNYGAHTNSPINSVVLAHELGHKYIHEGVEEYIPPTKHRNMDLVDILGGPGLGEYIPQRVVNREYPPNSLGTPEHSPRIGAETLASTLARKALPEQYDAQAHQHMATALATYLLEEDIVNRKDQIPLMPSSHYRGLPSFLALPEPLQPQITEKDFILKPRIYGGSADQLQRAVDSQKPHDIPGLEYYQDQASQLLNDEYRKRFPLYR